MTTTGAVVSEPGLGFATVTFTTLEHPRFEDVSVAQTRSVCEPLLSEAVASVPMNTPGGFSVKVFADGELSTSSDTSAIPTLSDAFALKLIEPDTVDPLAGEVIAAIGGVLSVTVGVTHREPFQACPLGHT